MTAEERSSLEVLLELVRMNEDHNKTEHASIIAHIDRIEHRLCVKIDELRRLLVTHCEEQEVELAQRRELFEGEIELAKRKAIEEVSRPTVIHAAGEIIGRRLWQIVVGLALLIGMTSTILLILERVDLLP